MDIKRTILWVIFSLSMLFLWDAWQKHNGQASLFGAKPVATTTPTTQTPTPNVDVPTATPGTVPATTTSPAQASKSEIIRINTDLLKLDFDTTGAQIVRAEMLKQNDIEHKDQNMVLLDRSADRVYLAQSGVIGAENQNFPNHSSPFTLVSSERNLTGESLNVVFESTSDQVKVTKTFTFTKGSYAIAVNTLVTNLSDKPISPSLYLQLTRDGNDPPGGSHFYSTFTGPAFYSSEAKFQKIHFKDIEKGKANYISQAKDGWLGMIQHYFVSAWVPPQGVSRTNQAIKIGDNLYAVRTILGMGTIAPAANSAMTSTLWIGPQDQKSLVTVAEGLDLVVDYGWITIIAKPLSVLMGWIHSIVGNWGWTIVILTCLIKLVFYPLSAASYKSMARMKAVAPRMTALREKYGDDKAKLNQAMMEMYRTEKINPLGGCLPMVIQIPVFMSLYWVLLASVEIRNAPWMLWITDLASPDPFFILPALMMGTMFLQMRLNPKPPDPMQAKVMMAMPIVFGGMMFFFPAGLVLYWVVNNTLSIAQQWSITRSLEKKAQAA